jgi:hypothetical protein
MKHGLEAGGPSPERRLSAGRTSISDSHKVEKLCFGPAPV